MSEADDVSMFSYRTITNDKYFIPEGADLDQIADQLLNKKSKLVQKMELGEQAFFKRVQEEAQEEVDFLVGERGQQLEQDLNEIRQINQQNPRLDVQVSKIQLADELLIKQFEEEEKAIIKQRPSTATQKPPLVKQTVKQSIDQKVLSNQSAKLNIDSQDVEMGRMLMLREDQLSL